MPLKPWYKVVTPREDLREGKPLDAAEFAVAKGLKLKVTVEVAPEGGISKQKVEETKASLRELGMNDDLSCT